jgi:hypothetical protein
MGEDKSARDLLTRFVLQIPCVRPCVIAHRSRKTTLKDRRVGSTAELTRLSIKQPPSYMLIVRSGSVRGNEQCKSGSTSGSSGGPQSTSDVCHVCFCFRKWRAVLLRSCPGNLNLCKCYRMRLGEEQFTGISSWQTTMNTKNSVFWDVTPCGSCNNRRFRGT